MEFSQWVALYRDMREATSLGSAFAYLIKPPGWSPDGKSLTTEALRAQQIRTTAT
jgi:hypothetical protein